MNKYPTPSSPPTLRKLEEVHLKGLAYCTAEEIDYLLDLAAHVKAKPEEYEKNLRGKVMAMLFEKPSLRTRATFEIGMMQLGGNAIYIGPTEAGLGKRESVPDVAKNLSRWVHVIMARVFSHHTILELAEHGSVPVINGLCDFEHPCQALGDYLTLREHLGELEGMTLAYSGDGNNVLHSLLIGAARMNMKMRIACPEGHGPDAKVVQNAMKYGCEVFLTRDPAEAIEGAHAIYTDTWTSMGQETEYEARREIFAPFQVNEELMKRGKDGCLFMHCLPAHRGEEVTRAVIDGPNSVVFDQAENRLHIQKAILLTMLA